MRFLNTYNNDVEPNNESDMPTPNDSLEDFIRTQFTREDLGGDYEKDENNLPTAKAPKIPEKQDTIISRLQRIEEKLDKLLNIPQ